MESPAHPRRTPARDTLAWAVLVAGAAACFSPWGTPGIMLAAGMGVAVLGLADTTRFPWVKPASKIVLQTCVVILGLSMNLSELAHAGRNGIVFAMGTIVLTFAAGILLGRVLRLGWKLTTLLSSGTAICGGSAIAAVSTVIAAGSAEVSVAMATVFCLNAVGLYALPVIGEHFSMSQEQFGTWAAISIHDVSSVTGAAQHYGEEAWKIATAVKLSRMLWIVPISIVARWWAQRHAHHAGEPVAQGPKKFTLPVPLFVLLFIAAAALRTYVPQITDFHESYSKPAASHGMALSLFLIGLGLTRRTLAAVGWRAMVVGVILWVLISIVSLLVVRATIA